MTALAGVSTSRGARSAGGACKSAKIRPAKRVTHRVIHRGLTASVEKRDEVVEEIHREPACYPLRLMSSTNLVGLTPSELEALAVDLGASRYRGRQLATWMYRKSVFDLDRMTDLPRAFRAELATRARIAVPEVDRVIASQDGSRKLVFRLEDDARVSAVLMPDDDRLTLCLSTQVGCGFECAFCLTGTMGLERNLTAAEIVGQLLVANTIGGPAPRVTHMVFMGMGEPLANYQALVAAIRVFTDARLGLGYSPRRITVSTVGLVPAIDRLGREDLKVNLAISLHAASDDVRARLMPVNRSWNLETLMAAVRRYPLAPRQRVFFEYVLLDGVNDGEDQAQTLVRLLRGLRAKVNLIPFNDWEGAPFSRPPLARILAFQATLLRAGVTTTVRWSKGEDIGAACGQLREAVPA
jgi:23S rRNA (adenine2503-C2)-methyltransferase